MRHAGSSSVVAAKRSSGLASAYTLQHTRTEHSKRHACYNFALLVVAALFCFVLIAERGWLGAQSTTSALADVFSRRVGSLQVQLPSATLVTREASNQNSTDSHTTRSVRPPPPSAEPNGQDLPDANGVPKSKDPDARVPASMDTMLTVAAQNELYEQYDSASNGGIDQMVDEYLELPRAQRAWESSEEDDGQPQRENTTHVEGSAGREGVGADVARDEEPRTDPEGRTRTTETGPNELQGELEDSQVEGAAVIAPKLVGWETAENGVSRLEMLDQAEGAAGGTDVQDGPDVGKVGAGVSGVGSDREDQPQLGTLVGQQAEQNGSFQADTRENDGSDRQTGLEGGRALYDTSVWSVVGQRVQEIGPVEYDARLDLDAVWEVQGDPEDLAKQHVLSRELVASRARGDYVMVTFANRSYLDMLLSWVHHAERAGIDYYVVGTLDAQLLPDLLARGLPAFALPADVSVSTRDIGWGSMEFHKMRCKQLGTVAALVDMGFNLIVSDTDTAWMQDPVPYFQRYPTADILVSSDSVIHRGVSEPDGLESWETAMASFNIGIMLLRPNSTTFIHDWLTALQADPAKWDQAAFNEMARVGISRNAEDEQGLFRVYHESLTMGVLPLHTFCSGHAYYIQHLPAKAHVSPFVSHADFQFGGAPGKHHRMREWLTYHDPPSWFDPPGEGFITWTMDLPDQLLASSPPQTGKADMANVAGHFELMKHQLLQIRTALALGRIFNRTVVFPPLWCGLDRYWAPHKGTIPPAVMEFPFACPLDHVLDVEWLARPEYDPARFGPRPRIREFSFFVNPRMPAAVNTSRLAVHPCGDTWDPCPPTSPHVGTPTSGGGPPRLEQHVLLTPGGDTPDGDGVRLTGGGGDSGDVAQSGGTQVPVLSANQTVGGYAIPLEEVEVRGEAESAAQSGRQDDDVMQVGDVPLGGDVAQDDGAGYGDDFASYDVVTQGAGDTVAGAVEPGDAQRLGGVGYGESESTEQAQAAEDGGSGEEQIGEEQAGAEMEGGEAVGGADGEPQGWKGVGAAKGDGGGAVPRAPEGAALGDVEADVTSVGDGGGNAAHKGNGERPQLADMEGSAAGNISVEEGEASDGDTKPWEEKATGGSTSTTGGTATSYRPAKAAEKPPTQPLAKSATRSDGRSAGAGQLADVTTRADVSQVAGTGQDVSLVSSVARADGGPWGGGAGPLRSGIQSGGFRVQPGQIRRRKQPIVELPPRQTGVAAASVQRTKVTPRRADVAGRAGTPVRPRTSAAAGTQPWSDGSLLAETLRHGKGGRGPQLEGQMDRQAGIVEIHVEEDDVEPTLWDKLAGVLPRATGEMGSDSGGPRTWAGDAADVEGRGSAGRPQSAAAGLEGSEVAGNDARAAGRVFPEDDLSMSGLQGSGGAWARGSNSRVSGGATGGVGDASGASGDVSDAAGAASDVSDAGGVAGDNSEAGGDVGVGSDGSGAAGELSEGAWDDHNFQRAGQRQRKHQRELLGSQQYAELHVPVGITDQQLRQALVGFEQYRVWEFSTLQGVFAGFEDEWDAELFGAMARFIPAQWCCVQPEAPGKPGHVWYDLWWDVVPHVDKFDRTWDRPWEPVTGP